ncbi:MAG: hypothetical protein HYS06_05500 [Methylocystis sp.]|nr:hypothetical protein [Methylocystis sp.]MBI3275213.1 hypothetical protein [Methylocystis sp.]
MRRNVWITAVSSLALTLVAGCAATSGGCPPLVAYSKAQQARAAQELRALSTDSQLGRMIVDYDKTRDACRVSQGR